MQKPFIKKQFKDTIRQIASLKNQNQEETNTIQSIQQESSSRPLINQQMQNMNFFEFLHTNEGFLALQSWFVKSMIICENCFMFDTHSPMTPKNVRSSVLEVDEHGLYSILKSAVENCDEQFLYNVFDTFKEHGDCYSSMTGYAESRTLMSSVGTVGFKEFNILVLLLCAADDSCLSRFLYIHGVIMFQMLAGRDSSEITGERMKKYARILGIKETILLNYMKTFELKSYSRIGIENFTIFYFALFTDLDNEQSQPSLPERLEIDKFTHNKIQVESAPAPEKKKKKKVGLCSQCAGKKKCLIF